MTQPAYSARQSISPTATLCDAVVKRQTTLILSPWLGWNSPTTDDDTSSGLVRSVGAVICFLFFWRNHMALKRCLYDFLIVSDNSLPAYHCFAAGRYSAATVVVVSPSRESVFSMLVSDKSSRFNRPASGIYSTLRPVHPSLPTSRLFVRSISYPVGFKSAQVKKNNKKKSVTFSHLG